MRSKTFGTPPCARARAPDWKDVAPVNHQLLSFVFRSDKIYAAPEHARTTEFPNLCLSHARNLPFR